MSETLLDCPFCGSENIVTTDFGDFTWFVQCNDCGATSPHFDTETEAIAAWNSRAGDDTNVATNADRIRSMSDEELAEWLVDANMCERVCIEEDYCGCDVCVNRVTDWLKQPAKEEHHEDD